VGGDWNRRIDYDFKARSLTANGGFLLFVRFLKSLGFDKVVKAHLEVKRSRRRYSTVELFTCLISMIVLGVERISHRDCLGEDRAFLQMLRLERFPSASALYRFLRAMYVFNIGQMARITTDLLHQVNGAFDGLREVTLDLDSTVLTVYGKQGGARVGYNPHKPGKRSYHPLLCFIAETGDYLYGKLRKGDAASATGLIPFFKKCLGRLPQTVERIRVRADAGFYSGAFFDLLEARDIGYAVPARVTRRLGQRLTPVSYAPVAADIEVGELDYQATSWDKARRMVVIRKRLTNRPDPQMPLFTLECYSYQVIATNITDMPPGKVWEFYKGRAVIENRIEEVKNQFNLSKIPSSDYMANACYFQMVMVAYNLTNWFRRLLLWGELRKAEVAILRRKVFTIAGKLVRHGRGVVLSLTRAFPRQEMFESVLARVGEVSLQIG